MVSSGLLVNLHFCGDYLSELAVFTNADECCCPAEKEAAKDGCCSDESVYVAFDADQLQQEFDTVKLFSFYQSSIELPSIELIKIVMEEAQVNTANAPPLLNQKIFLQLGRLKVFGDC
jgi:hypothetical protein